MFKKRSGGGGMTYISVKNGEILVPCQEDSEDAVPHEITMGPREGQIIYHQHFESVEGHITNAYVKESTNQYDDQLMIELTDKKRGTAVILAVPFNSRYAAKFYAVAKRIKLDQPAEFVPYHLENKERPGKFTTGWNVYQGGVTKENKLLSTFDGDDVPPWTKSQQKVKGKLKEVWDNSDEIEFYLGHFNKWSTKNNFGPPEKRKASDDDDEASTPKGKARPEPDDDDDEPAPRKKFGGSKSTPPPSSMMDDDEIDF